MSAISSHVKQSGNLIAAVDAVLNYRALILVLLGLVAAILVGMLSGATGARAGNFGVAVLGVSIALFLFFCGVNSAGVLLMDEAAGGVTRSFMDALVAGVIATLKLIVVLIIGVVIELLFAAAWALIYWACKIPVLGPVLFTVALPLGVIFLGVLAFGIWVLLPQIAAPAVWAGESIFQAIAKVIVVAQKRLLNVLVYDVVLGLVVGVAALIVWLVLGVGFLYAGAMATMMIGEVPNVGGMPSLPFGNFGGYSREWQGYALAGGIGGGLLVAAGAVVPMLILLKGYGQIYLEVTSNLDFSRAESELRQGVAQVKQRSDALRERVQQQNLASRQVAAASAASGASAPGAHTRPDPAAGGLPGPRVSSVCPNCRASISAADVFCGSCGGRLK